MRIHQKFASFQWKRLHLGAFNFGIGLVCLHHRKQCLLKQVSAATQYHTSPNSPRSRDLSTWVTATVWRNNGPQNRLMKLCKGEGVRHPNHLGNFGVHRSPENQLLMGWVSNPNHHFNPYAHLREFLTQKKSRSPLKNGGWRTSFSFLGNINVLCAYTLDK